MTCCIGWGCRVCSRGRVTARMIRKRCNSGLKTPDNITPLHVPPCSPELNPIERLWLHLKSHYLSNRVYIDYEDLLASCRDAWNVLREADLRSICHSTWATHEG